jgi:hypothetical protein
MIQTALSLTLLVLLFAATSCDSGPLGHAEVEIRVSGAPDEIAIGRSFPLTVVRVWTRELEPDPWNDAALAPLTVRLEDTSRREDAVFVEETRRFRAYAFEPGAATVPPIAFAAAPASGGAPRTASADGFTIRVKPTLDPKTAGPPELPAEISERARWWLWAGGALAALGGAALLVRASAARGRRAEARSATAEVSRKGALERIAALRAQTPRTPEEIEAWHAETSTLVRDFLASTWKIGAHERTTEELMAAWGPAERVALDRSLLACDFVRFGRAESTAAGRDGILEAAEDLVSP